MRSTVLASKRAKVLRRTMTPPEVRLWQNLRIREPGQPVFRRHHPYGPYILDFYCPSARLVVEVDGYSHGTEGQPEHDARRDAWLTSRGLTVHRIAASTVMKELNEAVLAIRGLAAEIAAAAHLPPP